MERCGVDPYEEQLLAVFESCDREGRGLLDSEGLSRLCEMLHLEESRSELMSCLLPMPPSPAHHITFPKFRDALLALLNASTNAREPSPVREVSPKFVYGQKKYGRRSRPESLDQDSMTIEEAEGDTFIIPSNNPTQNGNSHPSPDILVERLNAAEMREDLNHSATSISDKESEGTGEEELRAAWERLGVGTDGFLHRNELAMVCSAVGMDTLADQVVTQVFTKLNKDHEGRISFEEFLDLFRSRAGSPPSLPRTPPNYQGASPDPYVKSSMVGEMWDSSNMSGPRLLHELQSAKSLLESVTEERDKLRNDLTDANNRAAVLAQEVDEHHARIEKATRNKVKLLEQKHLEEIKEIKTQASLEREQLNSSNQLLEKTLSDQIEQINKLNSKITTLQKDFESLEKENRNLSDSLRETQAASEILQQQVDCMPALHQRVVELESVDDQSSELRLKISVLQKENTDLKDRNDELTTQLESLASKALQRREHSWESGGGGTKRRGKSPGDWTDSRLGKVRRCCTENDLTFTSQSYRDFRLQQSESGLESDIETLAESPSTSDTSLENVEEDTMVNKLVNEVSYLKQQLLRYQKEWQLTRNHQDDSMPCPTSLLSSNNTQVTNTSVSNVSDVMSCQSSDIYETQYKTSAEMVGVEVQTNDSAWCHEDADRQCHRLHLKLEHIQEEILKIISEKKACSAENCALKKCISELVSEQNKENSEVIRCLLLNGEIKRNRDDFRFNSYPFIFDDKYNIFRNESKIRKFDKLSQFAFEFVNSPEDKVDFCPIPMKIDQFSQTADCDENGCEFECLGCTLKSKEIEKVKEENVKLVESLELLREEYEKTEDYWASKLEEERNIFEMDQLQSDEKFTELQVKIQEYSELLAGEQGRKQVLPTIEERDFLEKQFTDLEEEFEVYRQSAEDEIAQKDSEISNLEQALATSRSPSTVVESIHVEVQTDLVESTKGNMTGNQGEGGENRKNVDGCCCSCHEWEKRDVRRTRELRARLRSECDALMQQKEHLIYDLQALHVSSQINGREVEVLSYKLRQQESRCKSLETALRQHHKESEKLIQKAWERHKAELNSVQKTLKQTRDRLERQASITKKQLGKLRASDLLVKELFMENSRLVLALAKLEEKTRADSPLFNSF